MALAKTLTTVVSSTSNSAGGTTRGVADVRTKHGGLLTLKITNGGTGPSVACQGRVLVSHAEGATPTAASAGADWKTVFVFDGGTANNAVTEQHFVFGPGVQHIEVEFTGNTGQAVTVEALLTTYTLE